MRASEHSPSTRRVSSGRNVALNFLPFREQDFVFRIYRRKLAITDQAVPGTRWLPDDCTGEVQADTERFQYAVSLIRTNGYEETSIRAWVNPGLTVHILYEALVARARADDLAQNCEFPDSQFLREVGFILKRHGDAREMMSLRPFELRANGHFGMLCKFSLRWPPNSTLPEKTRLELSLTHKNGPCVSG
jgi:hypothetical protein